MERMQYRVEFLEVVQEGEHASYGRGETGERKGNMDLRENSSKGWNFGKFGKCHFLFVLVAGRFGVASAIFRRHPKHGGRDEEWPIESREYR